ELRALEKYSSTIPNALKVQLIPRHFVLGIGCRKGISFEKVLEVFQKFCRNQNINPYSISKIVSIDIKSEEQAIIELAHYLTADFETFSSDLLNTVEHYYPGSEFVKKQVGVSSVSQTAA